MDMPDMADMDMPDLDMPDMVDTQDMDMLKTQDLDAVKLKLFKIEEEKYHYEDTSKETLRQAVQEKLEAVQKVTNLEFHVGNLEDGCTHYRMSQEDTQKQLKELSGIHQTKLKNIDELKESLKEAENKSQDLQTKVEKKTKTEEEYAEKVKKLEGDLHSMKSNYDELQNCNKEVTQTSDEAVLLTSEIDEDAIGDATSSLVPLVVEQPISPSCEEQKDVEKDGDNRNVCQECLKKFPRFIKEEHNLLQSSSQFNRLSPEGGSTPVHESMGNDINGSTGDREHHQQLSSATAAPMSHDQLIVEALRLKEQLAEKERELNLANVQLESNNIELLPATAMSC